MSGAREIRATITAVGRRALHRLVIVEPIALEVVHRAPAVEACQRLAEAGYADAVLVAYHPDGRERFRQSVGKWAGFELVEDGTRPEGFKWRRRGADEPGQTARVCANGASGYPEAA